MDTGLKEVVAVYPDLNALSEAAAREFARIVCKAISDRGIATVVLSGGSTPKVLYEILAKNYCTAIDWKNVHLFWSDERFVPKEDVASNYRMVCDSLLDFIPIPHENVHPIRTDFESAGVAAEKYDLELHELFPNSPPEFDLVLLGIGLDGHTASIFPATNENVDEKIWAIPTTAPIDPKERISLTLEVINNAIQVFFLINGKEKAPIVHRMFAEKKSDDGVKIPSARIKPTGDIRFFLDEDAMKLSRDLVIDSNK